MPRNDRYNSGVAPKAILYTYHTHVPAQEEITKLEVYSSPSLLPAPCTLLSGCPTWPGVRCPARNGSLIAPGRRQEAQAPSVLNKMPVQLIFWASLPRPAQLCSSPKRAVRPVGKDQPADGDGEEKERQQREDVPPAARAQEGGRGRWNGAAAAGQRSGRVQAARSGQGEGVRRGRGKLAHAGGRQYRGPTANAEGQAVYTPQGT